MDAKPEKETFIKRIPTLDGGYIELVETTESSSGSGCAKEKDDHLHRERRKMMIGILGLSEDVLL